MGLLFDWFEISCMTATIFVCICKTDYSKPVKQEVNGTMILPLLVFPALTFLLCSKIHLCSISTKDFASN
jgi:hypothetical protein